MQYNVVVRGIEKFHILPKFFEHGYLAKNSGNFVFTHFIIILREQCLRFFI